MNLGENTTKALLTAAVAGIGSSLLFGETGTTEIGGFNFPIPVMVGASAGAGSWASDAFSDTILSSIPQNANYAKAEKLAVKLGVCGAATAFAMKMTTGLPNENILKAVGLGAASRAGADWISDNVINVNRSGLLVGL